MQGVEFYSLGCSDVEFSGSVNHRKVFAPKRLTQNAFVPYCLRFLVPSRGLLSGSKGVGAWGWGLVFVFGALMTVHVPEQYTLGPCKGSYIST